MHSLKSKAEDDRWGGSQKDAGRKQQQPALSTCLHRAAKKWGRSDTGSAGRGLPAPRAAVGVAGDDSSWLALILTSAFISSIAKPFTALPPKALSPQLPAPG